MSTRRACDECEGTCGRELGSMAWSEYAGRLPDGERFLSTYLTACPHAPDSESRYFDRFRFMGGVAIPSCAVAAPR